MKKIEASLIKRLSRISGKDLVSLDLKLSHYSLSLSYSLTLRFFLEHFGIGARKAKKARGSKDQVGKGRIKWLQQGLLQVSTCMCIFLARFGMHGIACVFSLLDLVCMGLHVFIFLPWHGFY